MKTIIGLMSGTSVDGVDAALVEVTGSGIDTRVSLVEFVTVGYSKSLRKAVLNQSDAQTARVDQLCQINAVLGERFAQAAEEVCRKASVPLASVDLIGSHGHTIHHLPGPERLFETDVRATFQVGSPSVIAERTGVTTISDFRSRDMAAGGQGAPLIPLVDYILFRSDQVGSVMLNIGGISNITSLPAGCSVDDVTAFDTGPGNMAVDALVNNLTDGVQSYDVDGKMAAEGEADEVLLKKLMRHPFLVLPPPKSTGRETFGRDFVDQVLAWGKDLSGPDLILTATTFTVMSISDALVAFVFPKWNVDRVIVSGGGSKNPEMMRMLMRKLSGIEVITTDAFGIPSEAKEAIGFAVLANQTLGGMTGSIPSVTGAKHASILGSITPGAGMRFSVDS